MACWFEAFEALCEISLCRLHLPTVEGVVEIKQPEETATRLNHVLNFVQGFQATGKGDIARAVDTCDFYV